MGCPKIKPIRVDCSSGTRTSNPENLPPHTNSSSPNNQSVFGNRSDMSLHIDTLDIVCAPCLEQHETQRPAASCSPGTTWRKHRANWKTESPWGMFLLSGDRSPSGSIFPWRGTPSSSKFKPTRPSSLPKDQPADAHGDDASCHVALVLMVPRAESTYSECRSSSPQRTTDKQARRWMLRCWCQTQRALDVERRMTGDSYSLDMTTRLAVQQNTPSLAQRSSTAASTAVSGGSKR